MTRPEYTKWVEPGSSARRPSGADEVYTRTYCEAYEFGFSDSDSRLKADAAVRFHNRERN